MHPFPPSSRLQFLVGKQLEQICLGRWRFDFQFEVGNVVVEGNLEHIDAAGAVHRHNTDADRTAPLYVQCLIGQKVNAVAAERNCLSLTFERGDQLRISSENGRFEDGQIYNETGTLIVF
jgi:hypothetical protein